MIINPYLVQPSGPSYGTLTTAWIAATGETDLTIIGALNTLETDMATYGLTSKMKALYPMVGGTAAKHKFNFMDAQDTDAAYRLLFSGGWTHSSTGALPNGTNAYADTKLNATLLTQDNTHLSVYSRTNSDGLFCDIGYISTSTLDETNLFSKYVNVLYPRIQATNSGVANSVTSAGLMMANRISSTVVKGIRNTVITNLSNNSSTKGTSTSDVVFIGALNRRSVPDIVFYSPREYALASIGTGLTDTEAANFYTAVQRFQTTLGRQVGAPLYDNGTLLLDTYTGSSAAYSSARKIRNNYDGYAIRVRRSSDNTEQDIPFTSLGVLDESALTTFVGAGDGFVTTWYDQSGNSKNATQTTAVNQHRIVSSGTVEKDGGKPCLNTLTRPPLSLTTTDFRNSITVAKVDTQNLINYLVAITSPSFNYGMFYNGSFGGIDGIGGFDGANIRSATGEDLNRHLAWLQIKSGNLYAAKDGASESNLGTFTPPPFNTYAQANEIGGRSSSSILYFQGKIQEVILYNSDQTSNKSGINTNINTFYSIY